jgi:PAS domain S-box-containing protein
MSRNPPVSTESIELHNETARLMIRAAAIVLSATAVLGVLALPVTPNPAGRSALVATLVAVAVAWRQTVRPRPDAFILLLIWETLTALAGYFAQGPIANAQTMSLFAAVFLGVFLLEGRRMWIVIGYAWVVWGWMMTRIAPGLDQAMMAQIAINHAITLAIGIGLMLTLRRRMQYVIERAVGRFHRLPVGAFRAGAEGEILEANDRFVSILGYDSVEDLGSRNLEDFFVDTDQSEQILAAAAAAVAGDGAVQGVCIRLFTKDGRQIDVRGTFTAAHDGAGAMVLEGAIEDISALSEATRRAQMAEDRFATAFDSAPVGMLMLDPDGSVLKANGALLELLGYTHDGLAARRWSGLGDGSAAWNDLIRGDSEVGREYLIPRADDNDIWVLASAVKVEDVDGAYHFVQLVDVTPQRTLQDSLKALVQAKDEFIASVSHELRTPLTAVVGFSDMLVHDRGLAGEERDEVQELVLSQALSVSHIVDDLLVAARADNGGLSVTASRVDLGAIARSAVADCDHAAGEKGSVRIEGSAEAWADPERVRQILRNLVTNAYRYGGDEVTVTLSNGGSLARVSVSDNGDGIDPDAVESIWEPYSRAHLHTLTTTESIGLGLTVSRRLATLMGGELTYRYGDGLSVFELTLPSADRSGLEL